MMPGESVNQACADELGNTATNDATAAYCPTDNTIYFSQQDGGEHLDRKGNVNADPTSGSSGGFSIAYAITHERLGKRCLLPRRAPGRRHPASHHGYDFSDPSHHGTPAERTGAFLQGYNTGQGAQCALSLGDLSSDGGGQVLVFN